MRVPGWQTTASFLDKVLDNRYVRWAGGAFFLFGLLRAVVAVVGNNPLTVFTVALIAVGVILLALPYIERQARGRMSPAKERSAPESPPTRPMTWADLKAARVPHTEPPDSPGDGGDDSEPGEEKVKPTARSSSPSGMAALEKLYTEGDRMQKAATPFIAAVGGLMSYGPPPSDADIDNWKRRVLEALPPAARGKFRVAPLKAEVDSPIARMAGLGSMESEKARRLKRHMQVLEEIMGRLA
ncbi:MAG: hypothetical protein WD404_09675 [Solirubrobacterales bacterium]